ncbi:MAG: hypothetical protein SF028_02650 [Candidatus Sumerlaeia bacterium]|nr:hypothetical protein [Candidatus Sumerlaeia bacterium]
MSGATQEPRCPSVRQRIALFLLVFFAHTLITPGHLTSPDEELMFRMAESMALRGSSSIRPIEWDAEQGRLLVPPEATFATRQGADGRFFAQYLPLQPLLSAPLVWGAHATEGLFAEWFAEGTWPSMAHQWHTGTPAEFYHRAVVAAFFNPLVSGATALALAWVAGLLGAGARARTGTALLWAFATIGFAHARTYFTEPLAQLFAVLAIGELLRWRLARPGAERAPLRMAAWLSLGVWVRVDFPLIAAGLLAVMAWWSALDARGGKAVRTALVPVAVPAALSLASFLLLQKFQLWRLGGIDLTAGYGDQSEGVKFSTPLLIGLQGLLFSPGKGLLFFSPGLLLGAWGWLRGGAEAKAAAQAALLGMLPFFLAMALWQNWEGGWCWGPRHIVQVHAPIMLGAAFLLRGPLGAARRLTVSTIAAVGLAVQLYGAWQSPLEFFTEYFNTPADGEYLTVPYRPGEEAVIAGVNVVTDATTGRRLAASLMPAPLSDSLYVPQHTQWAVYPAMAALGYNDLYWWRRLFPRESPDRWGQRP